MLKQQLLLCNSRVTVAQLSYQVAVSDEPAKRVRVCGRQTMCVAWLNSLGRRIIVFAYFFCVCVVKLFKQ